MIYLDNAATTLHKPAAVARAMERAVGRLGSPGRGGHKAALRAAEEAYLCREQAARQFGVESPDRVVFCMNATHALNLAIKSLARPGDPVVISGYEHNAVLRPLTALGAQLRVAASPLFDQAGAVAAFREQLRPEVRLAVVNHVSNVFGFVLPVAEIAALCRQRGVPLIVDASQSAGVCPVDQGAWGAAFVAMPGHKGLYGPQGTGLLLCGADAKPLMEGGSGSESASRQMPAYLPDRLEAGTHNMPGIAGLHEGLRFVEALGPAKILDRERALCRLAVSLLQKNPRLRLYAAKDPAAQTGVLALQVRDLDCELAAARLSERGIALRAGLHCAPLAHETAGTETGAVRISFSVFNTEREVRRLAQTLENL